MLSYALWLFACCVSHLLQQKRREKRINKTGGSRQFRSEGEEERRRDIGRGGIKYLLALMVVREIDKVISDDLRYFGTKCSTMGGCRAEGSAPTFVAGFTYARSTKVRLEERGTPGKEVGYDSSAYSIGRRESMMHAVRQYNACGQTECGNTN